MSFRDDYNNYYWTNKYYEDRDLHHTLMRGFDNSDKAQNIMMSALSRKFDKGIEQINSGQMKAAEVMAQSSQHATAFIGGELRHMSQAFETRMHETAVAMGEAISRSSEQISFSIQDAADFLGLGLSKISWNIEQLTEVSRATLEVLTESLSNESRQYLEQGKICFQKDEYAMSRDLFERALESNRLNFIAYEYLGFIGIENDDPNYARRQFELAVKFAPEGHHRAIALSHLARCVFSTGNHEEAEQFQTAAVGEDSPQAWLWYELARYRAYLKHGDGVRAALRESIERDWNRWALAVIDEGFDPVRKEVSAILSKMKEEALAKAQEQISELQKTIDSGKAFEIDVDLGSLYTSLELISNDNVYAYLKAREISGKAIEQLLYLYENSLNERIKRESDIFVKLKSEKQDRIKVALQNAQNKQIEINLEKQKLKEQARVKVMKRKEKMEGHSLSLSYIVMWGVGLLMFFLLLFNQPDHPSFSVVLFLFAIIIISWVLRRLFYSVIRASLVGDDDRLQADIRKEENIVDSKMVVLSCQLEEEINRSISEIEATFSARTDPIKDCLKILITSKKDIRKSINHQTDNIE